MNGHFPDAGTRLYPKIEYMGPPKKGTPTFFKRRTSALRPILHLVAISAEGGTLGKASFLRALSGNVSHWVVTNDNLEVLQVQNPLIKEYTLNHIRAPILI